jgi:hypothetical protein
MCSLFAFVVFFVKLHFLGARYYYPAFHRERLPVNPAIWKSMFWLIVPILYVLREYVFRD